MSTLKDVAAKAGVSITTASIIANGKGQEKRISQDTIQRVLQVMEELQYHPNQTARQLRTRNHGRTTIGFYWPMDIRTNMLGQRLGNLYSVIVELELDYEIVVQTFLPNHLADFVSPILQNRYDGVIIGGCSDQDILDLEQIEFTVPVVLLNRESRKFFTVGINNSYLGMQIAALIQRKGYTSCAVVKSVARSVGNSSRTKAFMTACRQLGIEIRPEWIFTGSCKIVSGAEATQEYCALSERPGVIYYEADCMAQGGLYTLLRNGLRVPEDVELIAVGTQIPETMQYLTPSISCVSIPANVDKQAMSMMIRVLREHITTPIHVELEPLVYLRDSFSLPEK